MDGLSGYNQILMVVEDIPKTAFRCPDYIGTFEWLVMPFGLKNAGATYQRAMNFIFHDMLGHHMQVYIDDIMVKSKRASEHINHLRKIFERMRHHQLKLYPLKWAFRVRARNFFGLLVHQRWIEVYQKKAKAISLAKAPQNKKELQKFIGQVNYLKRFISNMVGKTKEFFDLVKLKDMEEFRWDERHQVATNKIKEYISKHHVLIPHIQGNPLKLYLSVINESIGCLLA